MEFGFLEVRTSVPAYQLSQWDGIQPRKDEMEDVTVSLSVK